MNDAGNDEKTKLPIQMDEDTKTILRSSEHMPPEIVIQKKKYYPKAFKGEGFKGVVWFGKDDFGGDVAIKFTIHDDYMDKSYLEEAKRARDLCSSDRFARFIDAGITELAWPDGKTRKFVTFIEQWITGMTLTAFLQKREATPSFFISYVNGMCSALGILTAKGYRHDDLRPENVMIEEPQDGDITQEEKVKIIDTGSMKKSDSPLLKPKDDHRWFAEHLILIRNALRRRKPHSLFEERFISEIDPPLDRMFEDDRTAALWAPSRVNSEFESALSRARAPSAQAVPKLNNPFDYIAAEHIVSDGLLVRLFSDSCPWFSEVAGPNPVLITGPRGCGKSMVFRRLSLKALLYKSPEEISASQIAGFYISCSGDLRNRVSWLTTDIAANRFRNEILHYFNLLVAREIVQTMGIISEREDRETLFGFGKSEEISLHDFLMAQLQISQPDQLRLQGMERMDHALYIIEQKMNECYTAMRMGVSAFCATGAPFISDFSRFLSNLISYFRDRKLAILVDDFSIHRIPVPVQLILNTILWDRQGTYVSKVSAEKYGAAGIDKFMATSEIGRELREIDCGRFYLSVSEMDAEKFAKDLLDIRLKLSGYEGTADQLIGPSKYETGGLGESLRMRSGQPGRDDDQYHGIKTIAATCSGDVSNLLEIYRRIFEYGKVTSVKTDLIPAHIQHRAIQSVSRDLLQLIRNYVPLGLEMHNLVNWFGNLSRRILREAPLQKKGPSSVVPQTSRIEVDQPPGQARDDLATTQQDLMDELVRRAIFVEMEPGRARHMFTVSLRWQLRRIYCPAFGTTVYKNTAIKWTPDEFKSFLLEPKSACEEEFNKRWSQAKPEVDNERELFPK